MQGVLLQKRNKKTGEINFFEEWSLKGRSENESDRKFYSFQFFDFDEGAIEELTLNEEEKKNLQFLDNGSEIEINDDNFIDFFSDLGSNEMKVIEVATKEVNRGRYIIKTIAGFHKIGTIAIER